MRWPYGPSRTGSASLPKLFWSYHIFAHPIINAASPSFGANLSGIASWQAIIYIPCHLFAIHRFAFLQLPLAYIDTALSDTLEHVREVGPSRFYDFRSDSRLPQQTKR